MASEKAVPIPIPVPIEASAARGREVAEGEADLCDVCLKKLGGDLDISRVDNDLTVVRYKDGTADAVLDGKRYTLRTQEDMPDGHYEVIDHRGYNPRTKEVAANLDLFVAHEERGFRYWLKANSRKAASDTFVREAERGRLNGTKFVLSGD